MRSPCVTSDARYFCTHSSWNTCRSRLAKWLKFTLERIGKPRHRAKQSEPPEHKPSVPGSPPPKRPAPQPPPRSQQGWLSRKEAMMPTQGVMVTRGAGTQHRTTERHRLSARPQREGEMMTVESVCAGVGGQGGYRTGGASCQISMKSGDPRGMRGPRKWKGRRTPKGKLRQRPERQGANQRGDRERNPRSRAVFMSKSSFLRPPLRSLPPAQPPSPALAPDNPPQIPSHRPLLLGLGL